MIRILVTGANGQLAKTIQELVESMESNQFEFVFVDRSQLDITRSSEVEAFFTTNKFHYCINCAAYTNVEKAEEDISNAFAVNAVALKTLSEICNRTDVTLFHISTDYVFDGNNHKPYIETDETNPINQYGKSKLEGERFIEALMTNYFIIRTSWLYSKYHGNFVTTIINKIKEGALLNITDAQKGTPTSCNHLGKFILFLIANNSQDYGTYHLSGLGETSWYGFAQEIASYFEGYPAQNINRSDAYVTKASRPTYSVMNNDKAQGLYKNVLPWQTQLRSVIEQILE